LLALAVVAFLLGGIIVLLLLGPQDPNFRRDSAGFVAFVCAFAAFGLVGALLIWQRPGNILGWILATDGLLAVWGASADTYVDVASETGGSPDLLFLAAVWLSLWYWFPLLGLTLIFTPLLFPDGKPPSPRWRPVVWGAGLALGLITFLAAFRERIEFPGVSMDNPVGIPGIENPEKSQIGSVLFGFFIVFLVAALASVVVRYLRSGGVQREQIKWLMFATLLAVLLTLSENFAAFLPKSGVPFAISITLFPVAIAVAIFRYRLYDIDVIINRALVYGALTVSLVLVYLMGVAGVQTVFRLLTGQDQQPQLAVVASTLVIAALFNPLRRRVQGLVDRRFYRRKYDAAKTLEEFGAKLRDETDLEQLNADLLSVVRETMQPAHASLWVLSRERASGQEVEG
jgi:ABC-type multidrug transport system fused ATPase/permease subunit